MMPHAAHKALQRRSRAAVTPGLPFRGGGRSRSTRCVLLNNLALPRHRISETSALRQSLRPKPNTHHVQVLQRSRTAVISGLPYVGVAGHALQLQRTLAAVRALMLPLAVSRLRCLPHTGRHTDRPALFSSALISHCDCFDGGSIPPRDTTVKGDPLRCPGGTTTLSCL